MDDSLWCITLLINTQCATYTHYSNNVPKSNFGIKTKSIACNMSLSRNIITHNNSRRPHYKVFNHLG